MTPATATTFTPGALSRAARWLALALQDWHTTEGERWIYVLKTLVAAFCALWLAYRLGLDSPSTAMTTTIILALPSSGMVLEKSFYRLCGTVLGCTAALTLIGLFPQQPVLLLAGLALWVGLCTSGSALHRNAQSYVYVLAGYTACMIVLPAIEQPLQVFSLAVTRVAEVGLGIICSAVVSSVLLPRHQGTQVMRSVQARYRKLLTFCQDVLQQKLTPAQVELTHLQFAADVAALELGRSAALFEVSSAVGHARAQNRKLHAFNATFMTALTTFYTFHRLFERLQRDGETQVLQACAPLYAIVAEALQATPSQGSLDTMQRHLRAALALARADIDATGIVHAQRIDFDTMCELLERYTRDMSRFHEVYSSLAHDTPLNLSTPQAYAPKTPPALVIASGARAGISLALLALGAYFLAWPYASTAMLMAAVFCALASSSPRPIMMIRQVLAGFLIALPLSLVCVYCVLVHGDGFPMLVLSFAPFLAVGLYLMTNPAKLGVGLGMSTFITQMAPSNLMHIDGAAFLNAGMALIVGLMLAALVFAVLLPEHTMGHKDHVGPALWREALQACTAPAHRVKHRFDNRVRDLLSQLNAAAGPAPGEATRAIVRQALTLLEIGHSVIDLRELIASACANSRARDALQRCVDSIAAWLHTRGAAQLQGALAATLQAGAVVRAAQKDTAADAAATAEHQQEQDLRLHTALVDLHSIYTSLLDNMAPGAGDRHDA
ncbi:fusaric acid resistance protein [Janthinobacterium lividum]|uniref:Fusaric acid resistance protein n=1 Tax=Janthinobacterium lividum TaxID=29581 RepID=A0A1E8PP02_9BURK|nr:fusaric acid resistance protein [Janthinobacterium lividum]